MFIPKLITPYIVSIAVPFKCQNAHSAYFQQIIQKTTISILKSYQQRKYEILSKYGYNLDFLR